MKNTFQQTKIVDSSKFGYAERQSDVKFLCQPPFSGEGKWHVLTWCQPK